MYVCILTHRRLLHQSLGTIYTYSPNYISKRTGFDVCCQHMILHQSNIIHIWSKFKHITYHVYWWQKTRVATVDTISVTPWWCSKSNLTLLRTWIESWNYKTHGTQDQTELDDWMELKPWISHWNCAPQIMMGVQGINVDQPNLDSEGLVKSDQSTRGLSKRIREDDGVNDLTERDPSGHILLDYGMSVLAIITVPSKATLNPGIQGTYSGIVALRPICVCHCWLAVTWTLKVLAKKIKTENTLQNWLWLAKSPPWYF